MPPASRIKAQSWRPCAPSALLDHAHAGVRGEGARMVGELLGGHHQPEALPVAERTNGEAGSSLCLVHTGLREQVGHLTNFG